VAVVAVVLVEMVEMVDICLRMEGMEQELDLALVA
jgi:hypothetical protein